MHITTLGYVKTGLKNGHSYKRRLNGNDGWEYLRSMINDRFEHIVVGETNGGWGGAAELDISILDNGRFEYYGWILEE